ncbi:dsDNA nuclease domain-containing protein (plasmid) [Bacillus mycoides]|uniref:dsDNA nuclease domain-containing protein n=1 Tax=Bacillus mycoides TaxID=1405 RepID=UPI003F750EF8
MGALNKIFSTKPPENSGSRSANRFSFQKNWALIKILELHKDKLDYSIVLDYHDDVLVLDSETNPEKIDFYQIKTKSTGKSNWTIAALSKFSEGKDKQILNSMLGKLYKNKLNFPEETKSLNFVSNKAYTIKLNDEKNAKDSAAILIPFSTIGTTEREKVEKELKKEMNITECGDIFDCTFLHITPLSLTESKEHAIGKSSQILREMGYFKVDPDLFYKFLYGEIELRNDCEKEFHSLEDFIRHKSLAKSAVQSIINHLNPKDDLNDGWNRINEELRATNHFNLYDLKQLESKWKEWEVRILTNDLALISTIQNAINELIKINLHKCSSVYDLLINVYEEYVLLDKEYPEELFNKYEIQALILMQYTIIEL